VQVAASQPSSVELAHSVYERSSVPDIIANWIKTKSETKAKTGTISEHTVAFKQHIAGF
jgi:hypothetical protein